MVFHELKGYNTYCGPGVLALLLGITTDEAAKRIRYYSGQKRVTLSYSHDYLRVLRDEGWSFRKVQQYGPRKLSYLLDNSGEFDPGVYMITVHEDGEQTGHVIAVQKVLRLPTPRWSGWYFADNAVPQPTELELYPRISINNIRQMWRLARPTAITEARK